MINQDKHLRKYTLSIICITLVLLTGIGSFVYIEKQTLAQKDRELKQTKELKEAELKQQEKLKQDELLQSHLNAETMSSGSSPSNIKDYTKH